MPGISDSVTGATAFWRRSVEIGCAVTPRTKQSACRQCRRTLMSVCSNSRDWANGRASSKGPELLPSGEELWRRGVGSHPRNHRGRARSRRTARPSQDGGRGPACLGIPEATIAEERLAFNTCESWPSKRFIKRRSSGTGSM